MSPPAGELARYHELRVVPPAEEAVVLLWGRWQALLPKPTDFLSLPEEARGAGLVRLRGFARARVLVFLPQFPPFGLPGILLPDRPEKN